MSSLISVIIPTLNEEHAIARCLARFHALEGRWELIVADSGSHDRTVDVAKAAGATVIEGAPEGRGAALNAGAARARGGLLLFLHADTSLPADAYRQISAGLADPDVAATAFRIRMDRPEWRFRVLGPLGTLRFRLQRSFFGDQAIAVRRDDFRRVGGYREAHLMEDVDLSRRLRRLGSLRLLPAQVTTSARRFEEGGVARTLLLMTALQTAYILGVPADRLRAWYRHVRERSGPGESPPAQVDLAGLRLVDEHRGTVRLSGLADGPLLLIFLRWLG